MNHFIKILPVLFLLIGISACDRGASTESGSTEVGGAEAPAGPEGKKGSVTPSTNGNLAFKGTVKGLKGDMRVFLDRVNANGNEVLEAATVGASGTFYFKTNQKEPTIYRFRAGKEGIAIIVKEPGTVNIDVDMAKFSKYAVSGAGDAEFYRPFLKGGASYQDVSTVLSRHNSLASWYVVRFLDIMDGDNLTVYNKVKNQLLEQYPNSMYTKAISEVIGQAEGKMTNQPIRVGAKAPDIVLPNPDGKTIALSSLKGKVVLIDFWASWCGPCRRSNPDLVETYNKYKNRGFTVYSISLDKAKADWVKAIAADKLAWPNHVSELKYWQGAVSTAWGINSIPQTYLLDKNGKIVSANLHGEQLRAKIEELL